MPEKAPLSSTSTIVFPVNQNEKKFSRSVYSEAMTQGRVASTDINYALCFFEVIISRVSSQAELRKSFFIRYLMPFLILFLLKISDLIYSSGFVWFCFWGYCIFGVIIQTSNRDKEVKKAKADLEEVIKMVQPAYLKKGLRWNIPQDPSVWIELVKEYRQIGEALVPIVHHQERVIVVEEPYKPLSEEVNETDEESGDYTVVTEEPVNNYGFAAAEK